MFYKSRPCITRPVQFGVHDHISKVHVFEVYKLQSSVESLSKFVQVFLLNRPIVHVLQLPSSHHHYNK